MPELTEAQRKKQALYRDARFLNQYEGIWQSVGKCVFCDLKDKYIFFEENGVVMTVSLYAYIDGHFMIVPRRHIRSPKDLTQVEWETMRKFSYIAKKLIYEVHGITGLQLVEKEGTAAQSTVSDHLHFHCIPFDAPDLCTWNYRKLRYTPLESKELYKKARKKLITYGLKFEKKYTNRSSLPVICDALIRNEKGAVLFQERSPELAFSPDQLSVPGGRVDDFTVPFEEELAREVYEETGLELEAADFRLLSSRVGNVKLAKHDTHLNVKYSSDSPFVWNTYVYDKRVRSSTKLIPGDDCKELLWIQSAAVTTHQRISPGLKVAIARLSEVL